MRCPLCNVDLLISDRQGVEIDHCPQCRGVWLDRGELDKILDRTYGSVPAPTAPQYPAQPQYGTIQSGGRYDDDDRRRYGHDPRYGHPQKKKRGFLDDIFDFD